MMNIPVLSRLLAVGLPSTRLLADGLPSTRLLAPGLPSTRLMGVYCRYEADPRDYDDGRKAQGAHHYLGLVYSLTRKTAGNLHLLDIGCGTGNHAKYLLEHDLRRATLLDSSSGMLDIARQKLQPYIDQHRVVIQKHKLPSIPFDSASFDVVTANQVFHHLTEDEDEKYSLVRKVTEEAFRVLRPNSVFLVNSCTPHQWKHGFWFADLFSKSIENQSGKWIDQRKFLEIVRETGFGKAGMIVEPLDLMYDHVWYVREDGPLYRKWRNASSTVSAVEQNDLEIATDKIRRMKEAGTLKDYMLDNDEMRQHVGQYCIYYARKN